MERFFFVKRLGSFSRWQFGNPIFVAALHNPRQRCPRTYFKHSCYSCYSWSKSKRSVIVVAFDLAKQAKGLTIISARIKHHKRRLPHNRLQVIQKVMGSNQGPHAAHAGNKYQILLLRPCDPSNICTSFSALRGPLRAFSMALSPLSLCIWKDFSKRLRSRR